jgi:predicted SAM-dependent methyltransferase
MDAKEVKTLGKFDVVICNHVIEHLEKNEGIKLLNDLESIGKTIIIGTPVGYVDTEYNVKLHNNEFERHQCGWMPDEFKNKGYMIKIIKNSFMAIKNN